MPQKAQNHPIFCGPFLKTKKIAHGVLKWPKIAHFLMGLFLKAKNRPQGPKIAHFLILGQKIAHLATLLQPRFSSAWAQSIERNRGVCLPYSIVATGGGGERACEDNQELA